MKAASLATQLKERRFPNEQHTRNLENPSFELRCVGADRVGGVDVDPRFVPPSRSKALTALKASGAKLLTTIKEWTMRSKPEMGVRKVQVVRIPFVTQWRLVDWSFEGNSDVSLWIKFCDCIWSKFGSLNSKRGVKRSTKTGVVSENQSPTVEKFDH